MSRGPSADQRELVALAADVFATEPSAERVWKRAADAGLVGVGVPAGYGGAGLGLTGLALVLEQQGRFLAPLPLLETAVLGGLPLAAFGGDRLRDRWLPGVADGGRRLTAAIDLTGGPPTTRAARDGDAWTLDGSAPLVPDGLAADAVVVAAAQPDGTDGLFVVAADARGVTRRAVETTTHAVAADVTLAAAPAERLDGADAGWLADRARVGLAALMLGVAEAGVRDAAAYLAGREQFGRPLATFQAVSQQLGDAYCAVQAMRVTLWQAVWALERGADARASVDVAAWWATDAGMRVQQTVQHLHGGIGADVTYPVHRRYLWALEIDARLGGAARQLARLGPVVASSSRHGDAGS